MDPSRLNASPAPLPMSDDGSADALGDRAPLEDRGAGVALDTSDRPSAPVRRASDFPPPVPQPADVYEAVTRYHVGQTIRTLPADTQQRFVEQLGGIVLPVRESQRVRFLRELAGLSARLLEPGRVEIERAAALLARPGYREGIAREDIEALDGTFALIRDIALLCMRSSKPADYARLLSRPGVDIPRFVSTMSFFAGDRRVRLAGLDMARRRAALEMERLARHSTTEALRALLSLILDRLPPLQHVTPRTTSDWKVLHAFDIAAVMARDPKALAQVLRSDYRKLVYDKAFFQHHEMLARIAAAKKTHALTRHTHDFLIGCGIYRTSSGRMLRFGKMFKVGPMEGYVLLRPESLTRYGYVALTTADVGDATALLASEDERTVQHELQHVFDKIAYVESVVDPKGRGVHDARANMLWMEVRARLAEMAFSDLDKAEDALQEARENAALEIPERAEMRVRIEADRIVSAKMARHKDGAAIRRAAVKLLDQAYRQAYGLTYTQIVEPFKVVDARSARPGAPGPASWRPPA